MKKLRSILALLMVAAMMLSFSAVALAVDIEEEEPPVEEVIEIAAEEPALDGASELIYYPPYNKNGGDTFTKYLEDIAGDGFYFFYQGYGIEGNWVLVQGATEQEYKALGNGGEKQIENISCKLGDIMCRKLADNE